MDVRHSMVFVQQPNDSPLIVGFQGRECRATATTKNRYTPQARLWFYCCVGVGTPAVADHAADANRGTATVLKRAHSTCNVPNNFCSGHVLVLESDGGPLVPACFLNTFFLCLWLSELCLLSSATSAACSGSSAAAAQTF
eukprot:m.62295 g.62295  ORF g.62295 m.62295 type:complete len:140 (+) comp13325_c0_seq1:879-1298(+)